MKEDEYSLTGIFYTGDGKKLKGVAIVDINNLWNVYDSKGAIIAGGFWTLYLDRARKIHAPKTQRDKNIGSDYLVEKIKDTEEKIKILEEKIEYAKAAPSYKMELKFAKVRLTEYRSIYTKYFQSNALKFILEDWVSED